MIKKLLAHPQLPPVLVTTSAVTAAAAAVVNGADGAAWITSGLAVIAVWSLGVTAILLTWHQRDHEVEHRRLVSRLEVLERQSRRHHALQSQSVEALESAQRAEREGARSEAERDKIIERLRSLEHKVGEGHRRFDHKLENQRHWIGAEDEKVLNRLRAVEHSAGQLSRRLSTIESSQRRAARQQRRQQALDGRPELSLSSHLRDLSASLSGSASASPGNDALSAADPERTGGPES